MPDYAKVNAVNAADIVKINGVEVGSIAACNGLTAPTSGATRWSVATQDGNFMYAANSDLTSWTAYDSYDEGSTGQSGGDGKSLAFGKNASGQSIYMATRATANGGSQTKEIHISGTDVTSTSEWTNVDIDSDSNSRNTIMMLRWAPDSGGSAAGVWLAVGKQATGHIWRSTNGGSSWTAIDISGLTGHVSGSSASDYINAIASDGLGNWMFGQDSRIYYSSDNGQSWSVSTPFSTNAPGRFQSIVYTNNSWVICYSRQSQIRFRSCAASDITDWGDEVTNHNQQMAHITANGKAVKMCAANGKVWAVSEDDFDVNRFDVSGKTISNIANFDLDDIANLKVAQDIATDGVKVVVACRSGDLAVSTDLGASFSATLDAFQADGSNTKDLEAVTADVFLPL